MKPALTFLAALLVLAGWVLSRDPKGARATVSPRHRKVGAAVGLTGVALAILALGLWML